MESNTVSRQQAVGEVRNMAFQFADMYYAFVKVLRDRYGDEEALDIARRVLFMRAKERAEKMIVKAGEEGVERTDIEYLGWETEEINMQIVNTFLDNLFAFVGMLQDKQNIDYAFPQCNFDLLESLIMNEIGWENANEEVITANQHVQLEYTREKRDLEQIQKKTYLFETDNEMLIPFPFCLK